MPPYPYLGPHPPSPPDVFQQMLNSRQGTDKVIAVCAACHRVRDDHDRWLVVGHAALAQAGHRLSHSICPECMHTLYPEYAD